MYLIGKLVLDAIATEKPLITCISGLWKHKHAGFPLQELIAVEMFGVLILQDFWGRFTKRNIVPKLRACCLLSEHWKTNYGQELPETLSFVSSTG